MGKLPPHDGNVGLLGFPDAGDDAGLLGAVIVGLVMGIRWMVSNGKKQQGNSAIEILRQRYARGVIQKEEFEVKKKDLS